MTCGIALCGHGDLAPQACTNAAHPRASVEPTALTMPAVSHRLAASRMAGCGVRRFADWLMNTHRSSCVRMGSR